MDSSNIHGTRRPGGRAIRAGARRSVAAVMALASLSLLFVASARADSMTFHDTKRDTSWIDMTRVDVSYGKRLVIKVWHRKPIGQVSQFTAWVDTSRKRKGPEYRVGFVFDSDGVAFNHAHGWRKRGAAAGCLGVHGLHVRVRDDVKPFKVTIPGRCLDDAKRVRVAVRTNQYRGPASTVDWAPAAHTFLGWVRRT